MHDEECQFDGCTHSRWAKGLCVGHYAQQRRGKPLQALNKQAKRSSQTQCTYATCMRKAKSKNLCSGHYEQLRKGKVLKDLDRKRVPVPFGYKYCCICKEVKAITEFFKNSRLSDGLDTRCKSCTHSLQLQRMFNITLLQYEEMLEAQEGCCAICGKTPEEQGKRLAVDHDHECCSGAKSCGKCVRKLLCQACNTGIGLLSDNPELIKSAARYIEQFRESITKSA